MRGLRALAVTTTFMALMAASAASQRPAPLGSIVIVRSRDDTALFSTWLELRDLEAATGRSLTPRVDRGEHRTDDDPSFSPDGRRVAFYRVTPRVRGVFVVDADGRRLRRVFRFPASPIFWSPTGDRLLFSVVERRNTAIYRVNVDGSGLRRLLARPMRRSFLAAHGWSPDGTRILFEEAFGDQFYFHYEGPSVIQTASADGGAPVVLAKTLGEVSAAWSPDGRLVAFTRGCYTICNLVVTPADGGDQRALTRFRTRTFPGAGFDALSFAWSGRGGEILFGRGRTVYAVDARTRATRPVATLPCPRRPCVGSSVNPEVSIRAVSGDGSTALVELQDLPEIQVRGKPPDIHRLYTVALDTGSMRAIPYDGADFDAHLE